MSTFQKEEPKRKEFKYTDPNIVIGKGKYGPVSLILVDEKLYALKKIAKSSIDNPKRVQHVYTERNILKSIQSNFIVHLKETFTDK